MTELKEASEAAIHLVIRSEENRKEAHELLDTLQLPYTLRTTPPRASDELTARMHCAIRDVAQQVMWAGENLSEEDWKRLLVAAVFGQRVLPSPGGNGFVVLDRRTSRMSGPMKHDLTEYVYAFGAERGVIFTEPGESL
jgi:NinB protein